MEGGSTPLYSQSPLDPLSLQKDQVEIPKGTEHRPPIHVQSEEYRRRYKWLYGQPLTFAVANPPLKTAVF